MPQELARRVEGMAGLRNLLVHRYFHVDSERVYEHLRDRLGDFELLLRHLRAWIDRGAA